MPGISVIMKKILIYAVAVLCLCSCLFVQSSIVWEPASGDLPAGEVVRQQQSIDVFRPIIEEQLLKTAQELLSGGMTKQEVDSIFKDFSDNMDATASIFILNQRGVVEVAYPQKYDYFVGYPFFPDPSSGLTTMRITMARTLLESKKFVCPAVGVPGYYFIQPIIADNGQYRGSLAVYFSSAKLDLAAAELEQPVEKEESVEQDPLVDQALEKQPENEEGWTLTDDGWAFWTEDGILMLETDAGWVSWTEDGILMLSTDDGWVSWTEDEILMLSTDDGWVSWTEDEILMLSTDDGWVSWTEDEILVLSTDDGWASWIDDEILVLSTDEGWVSWTEDEILALWNEEEQTWMSWTDDGILMRWSDEGWIPVTVSDNRPAADEFDAEATDEDETNADQPVDCSTEAKILANPTECADELVEHEATCTGTWVTGTGCVTKPVVTKPAVIKPVVNEPAVNRPDVNKPDVTKPAVNRPDVKKLDINESAVKLAVNGSAVEPPISEPPVSEPPVSEPPVSGPPVTAPPVTGPPTIGPPVTGPPVSAPPISGPPVSRPPTTAPPVTGPLTNRGSS